MSLVERRYDEFLDSLTGTERVQRACALLDSVTAMLRHQLLSETPDLSERELGLRIAEILYLSDPGAQHLIRLAREQDRASAS